MGFFCELHSKEAIKRDIEKGYVSVLKIDGNMIGTGCFEDNHITRVYVLPEHQKMGYGTFIIKNIEAQIMEKMIRHIWMLHCLQQHFMKNWDFLQ